MMVAVAEQVGIAALAGDLNLSLSLQVYQPLLFLPRLCVSVLGSTGEISITYIFRGIVPTSRD